LSVKSQIALGRIDFSSPDNLDCMNPPVNRLVKKIFVLFLSILKSTLEK